MNTLWVGLAGGLGSIARYHMGLFANSRTPTFPWGTLAVNLLGSLLISVLMQLVLRGRLEETTRIAIGVGFLGGFTTYSTFNFETIAMAQSGEWLRAGLYVATTLIGCLALGGVGYLIGRSI